MAFWTTWLQKLGTDYTPTKLVEAVGIILSKSDGTADLWQSGGSGDALVSLSTASTAALASQTTLASVLAQLVLLYAELKQPSIWTPVVKSDDTVLTTIATKGIKVATSGNLVFMSVGAPTVTVTQPMQPGEYLPGQFYKILAATSCTGILAGSGS